VSGKFSGDYQGAQVASSGRYQPPNAHWCVLATPTQKVTEFVSLFLKSDGVNYFVTELIYGVQIINNPFSFTRQ
jgi:hypothetical protein